jgi:hypothetical protein
MLHISAVRYSRREASCSRNIYKKLNHTAVVVHSTAKGNLIAVVVHPIRPYIKHLYSHVWEAFSKYMNKYTYK